MDIELRVGEWYIIGRGTNQYNKACFDEPEKLSFVDEEFFQVERLKEKGRGEDKYTISKYEFDHIPKTDGEARIQAMKEIAKAKSRAIKQIKQQIEIIEKLDKKHGVLFWDNKYACDSFIGR